MGVALLGFRLSHSEGRVYLSSSDKRSQLQNYPKCTIRLKATLYDQYRWHYPPSAVRYACEYITHSNSQTQKTVMIIFQSIFA